MPYYLLLRTKGSGNSSYKNEGVFSAASLANAKKKLQKWVDMKKKPRGEYMFISSSCTKSRGYYMKKK